MLALLPLVQPVKALSGPCCEYAFMVSNTQPKPGEPVDFTGVITDQFGGGDAGVQVVYHDSSQLQGINLTATTDSNGGFSIETAMPQGNYADSIRYTLTFNDAASNWNEIVFDTFPAPSGAASGTVPALYSSAFGGRGNAYLNIRSAYLPGIIYIGAGYEQPILHGVSSLDQSTTNFLSGLANKGFNVVAPVAWQVTSLPVFPFLVGAMLKYGFKMSQVYLVGWSAGGIVAAWTLTRDLNEIFNLGVVMDAELNGAMNQTLTNPSVFTTVHSAGSVRVPHLLIWGQTEGGATSIQTAMMWAINARSGLARLDAFAYSHQWIGTNVESQISADIIEFFNARAIGTINRFQTGNTTYQVLTNSQLNASNTAYDANRKIYAFQVTGPEGTIASLNIAIPISSIDGPPVVLFNNSPVNAVYSSDASNYYIYVTYTQSTHTVLIGGQNTVPEFAADQGALQMLVLLCFLLVFVLVERTRRGSRRR